MASFDVAPDGTEVVFSAHAGGQSEAWSNEHHIYTVNIDGSGLEQVSPVSSTHASQPKYSPNGAFIGYLITQIPKYTADKRHLQLYDRTARNTLTIPDLSDHSYSSVAWTVDNSAIITTAEHFGTISVYRVDVLSGIETALVTQVSLSLSLWLTVSLFLETSFSELWRAFFQ